jgi:hypothetical protein
VLFIGRFNIPSSLTFQLFDNFDNIDFHIIRNNEDDVFFELLVKRPNIYFHSYMSTEDLISLMKKSHYIFLMPAYVEGYPQHKLSSLISLSYSTLCQLIVPEMWNKHLKLKSVVEYYDHKYLRPNRDVKLDVSNFDSVIDNIYQERCELIEHNKNVLDNMIGIVSQKNRNNYLQVLEIDDTFIKTVVNETKYGEIMYLHNDIAFVNSLYNGKIFDEDLIENNLIEIIKKSKIILDVGAHCGSHSIVYSKINPNSIIYAFEPQNKLFKILNKNIDNNNIKNIITYNLALGNKKCDASMSSYCLDGPNTDIKVNDDTYFNLGGLQVGKGGELIEIDCIDN